MHPEERFKYIDRSRKRDIVLVPGWATDYRIFNMLDLNFNYFLPINFSPFDFEGRVLRLLKENKAKNISLFGFSLGGFVAAEFASKYKDLIDELILVGIRDAYTKQEIDDVKQYLIKSKKGYLYKFYQTAIPEKSSIAWFKNNLLKDYCSKFELKELLETLDFLGNSKIKPGRLDGITNIKIIHGSDDLIAPVKEARAIGERLPQARFIEIDGAGHMPFLNSEFKKRI